MEELTAPGDHELQVKPLHAAAPPPTCPAPHQRPQHHGTSCSCRRLSMLLQVLSPGRTLPLYLESLSFPLLSHSLFSPIFKTQFKHHSLQKASPDLPSPHPILDGHGIRILQRQPLACILTGTISETHVKGPNRRGPQRIPSCPVFCGASLGPALASDIAGVCDLRGPQEHIRLNPNALPSHWHH